MSQVDAAEPSDVHRYVIPQSGPYQSQHGEDRWLEAFFKHKPQGFFVEVGAYDGVVLSNSYFFETIGWSGVLVEPDAAKAERCRANRPRSQVFECAAVGTPGINEVTFYPVEGGQVYSTINMTDSHRQRMAEYGLRFSETRVRAMTLDSILEAAGAKSVDFVTIDVEEGELEVLKGFDIQRWRPGAVMVETNARFRKPEVRRYFVDRGYVFRDSVGINDIYVPLRHQPLITEAIDAASYVLRRGARKIRRHLGGLIGRAR